MKVSPSSERRPCNRAFELALLRRPRPSQTGCPRSWRGTISGFVLVIEDEQRVARLFWVFVNDRFVTLVVVLMDDPSLSLSE
jgi:hypothetical protein